MPGAVVPSVTMVSVVVVAAHDNVKKSAADLSPRPLSPSMAYLRSSTLRPARTHAQTQSTVTYTTRLRPACFSRRLLPSAKAPVRDRTMCVVVIRAGEGARRPECCVMRRRSVWSEACGPMYPFKYKTQPSKMPLRASGIVFEGACVFTPVFANVCDGSEGEIDDNDDDGDDVVVVVAIDTVDGLRRDGGTRVAYQVLSFA